MVPFCQLALWGVAGGWWVFGAVGRADYPEFSAVPDNPDNLVSPVFPVFFRSFRIIRFSPDILEFPAVPGSSPRGEVGKGLEVGRGL